MNDTTPEMSKKMYEMIQQKTPEERLKMGCSMYDLSKRLVIQTLLKNDPHLSATDLRVGIFQQFYGNDFSPNASAKIIKHLRNLPD
jgi:hypothetical protein